MIEIPIRHFPRSAVRCRRLRSLCALHGGLILFTLWFFGTRAYHFTDLQMAEFFVYALLDRVPAFDLGLNERRE